MLQAIADNAQVAADTPIHPTDTSGDTESMSTQSAQQVSLRTSMHQTHAQFRQEVFAPSMQIDPVLIERAEAYIRERPSVVCHRSASRVVCRGSPKKNP